MGVKISPSDTTIDDIHSEVITIWSHVQSIENTLTNVASDTQYTEEYLHSKVRWYGILAPQTAANWGDNSSMTPYVATSGNNAWGTDVGDEAQVIGTDDVSTSYDYFDLNEILISANSSATLYRCRIVWGTGTFAEAITGDNYSEFMYLRAIADTVRPIIITPAPKIFPGYRVWVQCWNTTDNATLDFFVGIRRYEH